MSIIQRKIKQVVTSIKTVEGGGFVVRRPLGASLSYIDPFLMLDHMGPVMYGPGEAVGAPDHPHRGFETVTYILQGQVQHKDSRGNEGNLGPGDVQWMTAGSGVVHSEMPSAESAEKGGPSEGFQLWVNLPKKDKMTAPRYQDTPSSKIPEVVLEEQVDKEKKKTTEGKEKEVSKVRIIAGEYKDVKAVIETRSPMMYLDIHLLQAGLSFIHSVPPTYQGFAYVYRGSGSFGPNETKAKEGQLVELDAGTHLTMKSIEVPFKCLLITGIPLNEPVARYGPFVMNTKAEIQQAFIDFQSGRMGGIEGSEERFVQTKKALKKSGGPVEPEK